MNPSAFHVLGGIPLFAGLKLGELEGLLRLFQRAAFSPGDCLVRQGQPADSAFIIESGTADAVTALPGGGELTLAALGPGSMLGEMALLDTGVRAATVVARKPMSAFSIEREGFRMLLAQRNRAAFTIQGRITLTLCQRLRELNAKIVACSAPDSDSRSVERGETGIRAAPLRADERPERCSAPGRGSAQSADETSTVSGHTAGGGRAPESAAPAMAGEAPAQAMARRGQCFFDHRAFLPVLPLFRRFNAAEIEKFAGMVEVMELERGQVLFRQGEASRACHVVVRGAVEIASARNGRRHRIGILGPGRLCGVLAMIEEQPHSMSAFAREHATLMEIGKAAFDKLYAGHDRVCAKFQDAINLELLQALARTVNHLTRLISQARIRDSRLKRKDVDDLERALCTQDCRPA